MQSKFTILFVIIALFSLSKANPKCLRQLQELEGTLTDLNYATQDQDIFGVSLGLKSVVKAAKPLKEACAEETFDFLAEREYEWIQGCQEGFGILGEILNEMSTEGGVLQGVLELEKFERVFQQTCFYTDDYMIMRLLDEAQIDMMGDLEDLIQGLLQDKERLVRELLAEIQGFEVESEKMEKAFLVSLTA